MHFTQHRIDGTRTSNCQLGETREKVLVHGSRTAVCNKFDDTKPARLCACCWCETFPQSVIARANFYFADLDIMIIEAYFFAGVYVTFRSQKQIDLLLKLVDITLKIKLFH